LEPSPGGANSKALKNVSQNGGIEIS